MGQIIYYQIKRYLNLGDEAIMPLVHRVNRPKNTRVSTSLQRKLQRRGIDSSDPNVKKSVKVIIFLKNVKKKTCYEKFVILKIYISSPFKNDRCL